MYGFLCLLLFTLGHSLDMHLQYNIPKLVTCCTSLLGVDVESRRPSFVSSHPSDIVRLVPWLCSGERERQEATKGIENIAPRHDSYKANHSLVENLKPSGVTQQTLKWMDYHCFF